VCCHGQDKEEEEEEEEEAERGVYMSANRLLSLCNIEVYQMETLKADQWKLKAANL
jgi:hypothetical protein